MMLVRHTIVSFGIDEARIAYIFDFVSAIGSCKQDVLLEIVSL